MKYSVVAKTDIGIYKKTNEDSLVVKHAMYRNQELIMAIVCDGMGGLAKGELASATVVRDFVEWFNNNIINELNNFDLQVIGNKWKEKLISLNRHIMEYGNKYQIRLGTTFTGLLLVEGKYLICHIGDGRVYRLDNDIIQLTEDHTFVQEQINQGIMTLGEADHDRRKHILTQCIGASNQIHPQLVYGNVNDGCLLICSDGFRNMTSLDELYQTFSKNNLKNNQDMIQQVEIFIEKLKVRNEQDNISCILINLGGEKDAQKW